MESFGPLLERDIIRVQLEQLETVLLKYLNDDFVMVKTEFDRLSKEKDKQKEQIRETFSTRIIGFFSFMTSLYRVDCIRYAGSCGNRCLEQRIDRENQNSYGQIAFT